MSICVSCLPRQQQQASSSDSRKPTAAAADREVATSAETKAKSCNGKKVESRHNNKVTTTNDIITISFPVCRS